MTSFQAAIEAARAEERDTAALVMAGDRDACVLAAAWKNIAVTRRATKRKCPQDAAKRWAWLWEGVTVDLNHMLRATGLTERACRIAFEKLRAGRLIYPDGSLHAGASSVLKAWLAQELADIGKR